LTHFVKPQRGHGQVENDEYAEFVARVLTAYGKRVAQGNVEDLGRFREILDAAEHDLRRAVLGLRAQGHSWAAIGRGLGITRQSAWERFGRQVNPDTGRRLADA
jgi:hypothetical protein